MTPPLYTSPQVRCQISYPGGYTIFLTQKAPWNADYVFDGSDPPYKPDSDANPLQQYGITKFAGEVAVLGVSGARVVILRVPVL